MLKYAQINPPSDVRDNQINCLTKKEFAEKLYSEKLMENTKLNPSYRLHQKDIIQSKTLHFRFYLNNLYQLNS